MTFLPLIFSFFIYYYYLFTAPHCPFWWRHLVGQPGDPVWIPPPHGGVPLFTSFDILTRSKYSHHVAHIFLESLWLTKPVKVLAFSFGPTLVGPKDLFPIQTPYSISSSTLSWAFPSLGPSVFIFNLCHLFCFIFIHTKNTIDFCGY